MPGTQYYDTRITKNNEGELALSGEAGTLTVIHFDLWHRGMANLTDKTRYMMKFQFIRMDAPQQPEWNVTDPHWKLEDSDQETPAHQGTWRHVWNWMAGKSNAGATQPINGNLANHITALSDDDSSVRSHAADDLEAFGESGAEAIPHLIQALCDVYEPVRLNAAYALGAIGEPAVSQLIETLSVEDPIMRRMAAYALAAVGADAVPALSEALQHIQETVRVEAAYALAQIGNAVKPAIPALMERTKDENVEVRRYLAEAFGSLGQAAAPAVPVLCDMLASDDDGQARFEAALALAQIGPSQATQSPVLASAFTDENRYVRDNAVLALKRIDTPEAETALFDYLLMTRWCPITNRDSTH